MKLVIERVPDLQALYVKQLRLLLSGEEMIAIKTPFLTERATDPELHQALGKQSEDAEADATGLHEILSRIGRETSAIKCKVVYALFDEAEDLLKGTVHDAVRDALVIAEAQRVKHYEIAAYGAVRQFARVLNRVEDERLLNQTIHTKGEADKRLSEIAERVNPAAKAAA